MAWGEWIVDILASQVSVEKIKNYGLFENRKKFEEY